MTKEEIIQAISDDKMMPFIQPEQLAQIVAFVINNYKPSLPSDIDGYRKAEKDLALTINDLELLHTFLYAVKNNKQGCFTFTRLSDEQYQEVLKRFKEAKK